MSDFVDPAEFEDWTLDDIEYDHDDNGDEIDNDEPIDWGMHDEHDLDLDYYDDEV